MSDDTRKGTGLGIGNSLLEHAPGGMRAVEIDPKKIGRDGYILIGQKEAIDRWMQVIMNAVTKTSDATEKRICEDILAGMYEDMERIEFKLAEIAHQRGALKVVDEFDLH